MLIALVVFLTTLFLIARSRHRKTLMTASVFLFLSSFLTILAVEIELWASESPDLTYGSDARYYWQATLSLLLGELDLKGVSAPLYVAWQTLAVRTSPESSFIWVLFANLSLFLLSFILQARTLEHFKSCQVRITQTLLLLALFWANGIVLWTVARGLKEVLIIFFASFLAYAWETSRLSHSTWVRVCCRLLAIGAVVALWYVRPFGSLWGLAYILGSQLRWLSLGSWAFFAVSIVYGLIILGRFFPKVAVFRELFGKPLLEQNPLASDLVAPLRFVLGPGPIRAFMQVLEGNVFLESTRIGDLLILIGSLQWWLFIAIVSLFALRKKGVLLKTLEAFKGWNILALVLVGTYSFIYFGTGDTRHRALLYLTLAPTMVSLIAGKEPRSDANPLPHHPR